MRSIPRTLWFFCVVMVFTVLAVGSIRVLTAQESPDAVPSSELVRQINAGLERDREEVVAAAPILGGTPCLFGMAGPYPCNNVDLQAYMPLATIGGGNGSANWGWTDPVSGREFAIMGRSNGTAFVEITDPINPIYLGNLPSHTGSSSWRELKTYDHYVFVVADNNGAHGMQVFDLNQLLTVATPPVTFSESAHYAGVTNGHTITTNELTGYAYIHGSNTCAGGLYFVNVQNPLSPVGAGCFSADGYTHDAQCTYYYGPDVAHQGKEICFAYNEDTLTIVDVTNKSAPVQLSRTGYTGSDYTHQGWLTENQEYLVLDDELDETGSGHNTRTYMWDVRNLDAPIMMGYYQATTPAIDHNQFFVGDYLYQANYRAGMRILNASDIANEQMTEVAYFDIYPANDNANFNAAWHVYPYFDSGNIFISGIEQGLFIVRPTNLPPDFRVHAAAHNFSICGNNTVTTTLTLPSVYNYAGSVTLTTTSLPTGLSVSFPNPVSVPGTAVMTITASNVTPGSYVFAIIGSDGTTEHYEPIQVKITSTPSAPGLTSPANGATGVAIQPTFNWSAVSGATAYDLQVATDAAFTNVVLTATGVTGTSYTPTSNLNNNTTYYWRVRASGSCGLSAYSAPFSFTTIMAAPAAPTLISPANGATEQPLLPTFTWNAAAGATSYNLQVATDTAFTTIVLSANNIAATQYTPATNLAYATTYYWRVLATNAGGNSPYSSVFSFTTMADPTPPNIYLPLLRQD